jgi:CRP/FNR family transcriptional regulator
MFDTHSALFKDLSEQELQILSKQSKLKVLAKQQYLCTQHSPADNVFNIASGTAVVERISCDGRRQILAFLFPGDFVGLSNSDHLEYAVKSLTDMTAHQFNVSSLRKIADESPTLENNLKTIQGKVLSVVLDQLCLLGQKKAHERLCFLLVHLLARMPNADPNNLELPMTRLDIADYLGLTVETVSRSMTKLKQEGLISITNPNALSILDLEEVEALGDIE